MTKLIRLTIIPIRHSNFIFICCLMLFSIALSAQTIVNREWVQNTGTPDQDIDWQASVLDANGDILTTSNTVTTGQAANIYTTKIDKNGILLWEREYNHTTSDKDYGAAIATDAAGNVYVVGAVTAANGLFDYMVLKYAANGILLWTATHNGASNGHDVPVAIAVDASGNVYVTGGSENGTALVDYCTIKYDSNGNQKWRSHYDYNNLYDAPVALQIDMSGDIVVTGVSADNTLNWESATVKYDAATGAETNAVRVTQTSGIHEPTDFDIDLYGNFYIVGNTNTGGTNYDIRTIKLSPELNIEWVEDYDGAGFKDGATTIDVDDYGNVFVGGYTYDATGVESALIIEYDEFGTQVAVQVDNNAQSHTAIKDIRATDGGVLVTGGAEKDGTTEMFVRQYDSSGNLVWQDTRDEGVISYGSDILTNGVSSINDNLFVTGVSSLGDIRVLTTTNYNTFTRPTDVVTDTDGNPLYMDRMVIVRFHRDAVNTTAVDNTDIIHGRAPTFLTSAAITELNTHLSFDISQADMIKVFKRLTSAHTTTTSRLGATVPIPDFWTSFVLVLPENVAPLQGGDSTIDVLQTCDDLERAFPTVRYAHPNFIAQLHGSSDDNTTYQDNSSDSHSNLNSSTANDPLYDEQPALHPATATHQDSVQFPEMFWDSAHINVEEAWNLGATGKPFVRVGLFDSGLFVQHEDFGYDDSTGLSPIIPDGWHLGADVSIYSLDTMDMDGEKGHGTKMAGVIGAIRNNQVGIAGVAGGDYSTSLADGTPDYGISMYPLKIGDGNTGQSFYNPSLEYVADAIVGSALPTDPNDAIPYDYGLHIMSNAWGIPEGTAIYDTNANNLLIQDAVHFVNRLNIIFVVSRGYTNIMDDDVFPATYFDPWVINVGASGKDLEFPSASANAPYGKNIDVVAPF